MKQQSEIKPFSNWQILIVFGVLIGVLWVCGLPSQVERNGDLFLDFAQSANASEIKEIELQRTYDSEKPIVIRDAATIKNFVTVLRTLQKSEFFRPVGENDTTITIRLKNGQIHQFGCYTLERTGKRMHIDEVYFSKDSKFSYSFGNLDAQFPNDDFYKWLVSVGVTMDE